jgi:hypothetical protein
MIEEGQQGFRDVINEGVTNKELSVDINPAEMAMKIFAMLEGGMMMSRVTGNTKYMHGIINMLKADLKSYQLK